MLLTRDKCFLRQKTGEVRMYDLSKSQSKRIFLSHEVISKLIQLLRRWAVPVMAVFILILSYLKRLMQAFLLALLGLGLASALETDLDVGELLSLAIVAMTPAMILESLWALSVRVFPLIWILWFLLIVGYYVYAINAAATRLPSPE